MSNRRAQDERIEGTPDGSNAITGIVDIPDAPTIGTATAGIGSVSVAFTPATTGGTASLYTATSDPGAITGTSATSPITVNGLTAGTSYTFTVTPSNSTGTGVASSASNSVSPVDFISAYDALATVTVPLGGAANIVFTGIPSGYQHLQLRGIARASAGSNNASLGIQVNGDSSSNQSPFHQLYGDGASASSAGGASSDGYTASLTGPIAASTSAANCFAGFVIDILDYNNFNKYKTIRSMAGVDFNGSGFISMRSTFNKNVLDPVSSLTVVTYNSGGTAGFAQYSSFALYGVK